MNIEKHTVVTIGYMLKARGGLSLEEKQVEQTNSANPFVFLFGTGMVLPDFEKNLAEKKSGDKFDFFISAENGYGIRDEKYIINISVDSFKNPDGTLDFNEVRTGNELTMSDNEGNQLLGKILEVTSEHVRMDFNHPLASHELHFTGEILDVRSATAEEITHGHVHVHEGQQH